MRILFILDPLPELKAYKDSSVAMMQAAHARGHELVACEVPDIWMRDGHVQARSRRLELTGQAADWYRLGAETVAPLEAFDAVLMRKDPPFDAEFLHATYLLERAQAEGARVFNDARAVRDHNEKLAIAQFPQFTAPTLVTRDPRLLREFVAEHGRAVFKLLDGMGGASMFQANADDPNLSVIIETMNLFGARSVMAQRYLPEIVDGDKRILIIDGEVVPYALARIPQPGEARGNLAAGATARAQALSARDRKIAETIAPVVAERGLLLVGLDVIGECLTEINVTSPTCFREIMDQTGWDVATRFIVALEKRVGHAGG